LEHFVLKAGPEVALKSLHWLGRSLHHASLLSGGTLCQFFFASLVRGVSLQNMDSGLDGLMLTFLEAYLVNGRWVERALHLSLFVEALHQR
jgi:hypothetical protein